MTASDTIVLVDGDAAIRGALAFSLGLEGFEVAAHASGEDLLGAGRLPEQGCLVLDQRLPGMSGLDLLAALRVRGTRLPAVILATAPGPGVRARAAAAGAALVEKPSLCDALTAAVRHALEVGRMAA